MVTLSRGLMGERIDFPSCGSSQAPPDPCFGQRPAAPWNVIPMWYISVDFRWFGLDVRAAAQRGRTKMTAQERWVGVEEVATHLKLSEVDEWVRAGGAGEDSAVGTKSDAKRRTK